jgi:hypothetical protein
LFRIEYAISRDDAGMLQLVMNEIAAPNPDAVGALLTGTEQSPGGTLLQFAPIVPLTSSRVLMRGLKEARFEYYQPAGPSAPAGWVSQWTSRRTELPRAMAIRVVANSGEGETSASPPASIVASVEDFALAPAATARRR